MAGPDFTSIQAALLAADKASEETNPWSGLEGFSNQFGNLLMQQAPNYDLQDNLVAGLLTGAISGLSNNLSTGYKNQQRDYASQAVKDLLEGKALSKDDWQGSPSVFNSLSQLENSINMGNLQERLANQRDIEKARSAIPIEVERQHALMPGVIQQKQQEAIADLGSAARKELINRQIEQPDRVGKNVMDIRKEFQALPEVKAFVTSDIGYKSLQKAIEDPSGTSDLELVRGAIQAIEPGMAVREGEQAAAQNSGSIPDGWKSYIQGALTGQSRLPEDVRAGILRIAERRYSEHASKFNEARAFYSGQANKYGEGLDVGNDITYLKPVEISPTKTDPKAAALAELRRRGVLK